MTSSHEAKTIEKQKDNEQTKKTITIFVCFSKKESSDEQSQSRNGKQKKTKKQNCPKQKGGK